MSELGTREVIINGVTLTTPEIIPGYTLQELVTVFTEAEKAGDDFAGDPAKWGVCKGILAILTCAGYDLTTSQ
jgi:hypothetical protein